MGDRIDYSIPTWDRTDSVSRTLVRLIAQSTNDGIWDWNLETDEVYYSPRWLELVGYLPDELPGHIDTFTKLLHPDDRDRAARTIAEYVAGTRPEYRNEFRLQHKDGSWRWIFTHGIAHRIATGRAIRLVGTHTDITDRVHAAERLESTVAERTNDLSKSLEDLQAAQDRLVQTEKFAALGRLVAGVAHEINTPVGSSLTVASTLINKTDRFEADVASGNVRRSILNEYLAASREAASQIMANLNQAVDLIQLFKEVAADRISDRMGFDLGQVTEQIVRSLQSRLRSPDLTFRVDCEPYLAMNSYPGPYGQVLTNLVLNSAAHAFPDDARGSVHITTRAFDKDNVEILIADDGCGMTQEIQRQAFNPFFTTRRDQGRVGLGLHIVYNIVTNRLGGRIDLDTKPGEGTRIRMIVPREAPLELAAE
jgi:PAS domain S-box-containing protein